MSKISASLFGFMLAVVYVPQFWGGATSPRWALAAIVIAIFVQLRLPKVTLAHLVGAVFLAWAALTLAWSANASDGIGAIINLIIVAGAFQMGASGDDDLIEPFTIGAAIGLTLSSVAAIAQLYGWKGAAQAGWYPSGLFVNGNFMAEAAAMVLVACFVYRRWMLIPGLLPALLLPNCRGAIVAVVATLGVALWFRSRRLAVVLVLICIPLAALFAFYREASIGNRFIMWGDVIPQITLFGRGLGSFYTLYPYFGSGWDSFVMRPEHAHNDLLEVAFELGMVGAVLASIWIWSLDRSSPAALIGVCFLVEGWFEFPLHLPFTAIFAGLVAGTLARWRPDFRDTAFVRGIRLCYRHAAG